MGVEACRTAKHSGLLLAVLRRLLRGAEIGAGKHNRLHARCLCALDHLIKVGIERVMRKIGADKFFCVSVCISKIIPTALQVLVLLFSKKHLTVLLHA